MSIGGCPFAVFSAKDSASGVPKQMVSPNHGSARPREWVAAFARANYLADLLCAAQICGGAA
jgi:hypothetical protein